MPLEEGVLVAKARRAREVLRFAVAALSLAVVAATASAGPAAAGPVRGHGGGTCRFPQGDGEVPVGLALTLPEAALTGQPVQATGLVFTVELPASVVDALRNWGAVRLEGHVGGELAVRDGGGATAVVLAPMRIPLTTLPAAGALRIPVYGTVPPVIAHRPGRLTVELAKLTTALVVHGLRDQMPVSEAVSCTPGPAPPAELGAIPVRGSELPAPPATDGSGVEIGRDGRPEPQADGGEIPVSLEVDGLARIAGLGGVVALADGRFDAKVYPRGSVRGNFTSPVKPGSFAVPGAERVTGALEFTQYGEASGAATVKITPGPGFVVDADLSIKLFIRLLNAEVDGRSLDVGGDCRTQSPISLRLKGTVLLAGGSPPPTVMGSGFAVPPFAGCGVTEDLDPLFTDMVSGPGNELTTTLILRCFGARPCPVD
ncbi:DUF6801 domain-containing protein [Amycolatopsis nigrescens]|uniref:DUF6801 domain-containing protein n=1 Tax=Amycolatopsis nigrescens TaxID=381445 RepID=UPI000382B4B5|nr:DUF6801 domain-containing protein [Amycolatopsis nigrescens]